MERDCWRSFPLRLRPPKSKPTVRSWNVRNVAALLILEIDLPTIWVKMMGDSDSVRRLFVSLKLFVFLCGWIGALGSIRASICSQARFFLCDDLLKSQSLVKAPAMAVLA